ncbi:MAG: selenium cofactor biosynthesis protein YqeC [Ardenticatenia bacterium]|nr:selenium cofactor biosynthesis protein YqeC [Ardenticatenia bacterium]
MYLREALRVRRKAVIAFVGGGGKTTAMFRLADELAARGWRVISTTTTRLFEAQAAQAPTIVSTDALETLTARLDIHGHVLVAAPPTGDTKRLGIAPEMVDALAARPDVDAVIVEADGSRRRPFKAPADFEPVVPAATTHLVPVVGVDAVGRPLDGNHVHRPERVMALTGALPGVPVSAELVARVLAHPKGGAKGRPPGARLVPLVNRVERPAHLAVARELAGRLLEHRPIDGVLIGAVRNDPPVHEVWERVAGIVLAAGMATRFGAPKQLLPWKGTAMVDHVAGVAVEAGLSPVIVVIGHEADRVGKAVASRPVRVVVNPDYAKGQSTSVRRGIEAVPASCGAAIFLLADQPSITPQVIRRLVQAHRETLAPIVAPTYAGRRATPCSSTAPSSRRCTPCPATREDGRSSRSTVTGCSGSPLTSRPFSRTSTRRKITTGPAQDRQPTHTPGSTAGSASQPCPPAVWEEAWPSDYCSMTAMFTWPSRASTEMMYVFPSLDTWNMPVPGPVNVCSTVNPLAGRASSKKVITSSTLMSLTV